MHGIIYGMGVNDMVGKCSFTSPQGKSKSHVWYKLWKGMLERCYSNKYQDKYPTYYGCSVCEDWKILSNFKEWFDSSNYRRGWHLDKDISIPHNKEYSPSACSFIPGIVNTFVIKDGIDKNGEMKFTTRNNGSLQVKCRNPITHKNETVGTFTCIESATRAYYEHKLKIANLIVKEYGDNLSDGVKCGILMRYTKEFK